MFSIKDCGLMIEPQQGMSVEEIVKWAQYAEREGYGYFFRSDHLLPTFIDTPIDTPECWTSLGVVAASTSKIKFGSMVSPVGTRNPALLARMACTLDSYSRGRMILSVGTGWYEPEYKAHGFEYPKFAVRFEELKDALNIVCPMTEGKRVDYDGKYYSAHVECFPKPFNGKIRLVLGGRNPKIVGLASEYADEVNIFSTPIEKFVQLRSIIRAKNENIDITHMGSFIIGDTKKELDERIASQMRSRGVPEENAKSVLQQKGVFCGSPEEVVSMINERREIGVSRFYFQILDPQDGSMVDTLTETIKANF